MVILCRRKHVWAAPNSRSGAVGVVRVDAAPPMVVFSYFFIVIDQQVSVGLELCCFLTGSLSLELFLFSLLCLGGVYYYFIWNCTCSSFPISPSECLFLKERSIIPLAPWPISSLNAFSPVSLFVLCSSVLQRYLYISRLLRPVMLSEHFSSSDQDLLICAVC